jgi:hypothetical protein
MAIVGAEQDRLTESLLLRTYSPSYVAVVMKGTEAASLSASVARVLVSVEPSSAKLRRGEVRSSGCPWP